MISRQGAGIALGAVLVLAVTAGVWRRSRASQQDPLGGPSSAPGASPDAALTSSGETPRASRQDARDTPGVQDPELELPPLDPRTDAEAREVVRFAAEANLSQLPSLERMLQVEQPLVVGNAVRALGRLGMFTPTSSYMVYLDDDRERVRAESVRALGLCGDAQAVPHLARVLGSQDADLRRLALKALGEIGGEPALAALRAFAPRDATEQVFLDEALARAASSRRTAVGDNR